MPCMAKPVDDKIPKDKDQDRPSVLDTDHDTFHNMSKDSLPLGAFGRESNMLSVAMEDNRELNATSVIEARKNAPSGRETTVPRVFKDDSYFVSSKPSGYEWSVPMI